MNEQKKIMFLGGSVFQLSAIRYAKARGHYVITCDYKSENPGHQYADEFYNISTTNQEAVLKLAENLHIDGIVAYASDPAAPTQAYVANKLGLPSNPYSSVNVLARKDLFRDFLKRHNFLVPESASFYQYEAAEKWAQNLNFPIIIKPVDSSGSKGVTKIQKIEDFNQAFNHALYFSREKKVIVEEFFMREGYQVAGDGFVVNGQLVFTCWANEHFDKLCNTLVPIGESFPSIMSDYTLKQAWSETQRLIDLLGINTGAFNFDFHYNAHGDFSFLELGPRNGGNLIPEVIKYATGVDLIRYTVDAALGFDCSDLTMVNTKGYYSSYMIHATENGSFEDIRYSNSIQKNILEKNIFVNQGDQVHKFNGSHHTLGTLILQFESQNEMLEKMDNMENYLKVCVS